MKGIRLLLIFFVIAIVYGFAPTISSRYHNNVLSKQTSLNMGLIDRFKNIFKRNKVPENGYDYIIVGGGTAGCVLANRLSADPNCNVLVLEAGTSNYKHNLIEIPAGILRLFKNPKYDWDYETSATKATADRNVYLCRGKVLGGSSCTNVLLYHRGNDNDYKYWAETTGDSSWGPDSVLPYFKKSQDDFRGESLYHSEGGEFAVSEVRYQNPLSRKFLQACGELGYPANDDFNNWSRSQEGYGRYQVTERNGARCSTASGFLQPIIKRKNLHIKTGTIVSKVLFDNKKAVGVELNQQNRHNNKNNRDNNNSNNNNSYNNRDSNNNIDIEIANLSNNGEVLLAGGAINSPQTLMLSGIGPGEHLEKHNIPTLVNSPGVGSNLQDHPAVVTSYACKPEHEGISVTSKIRIKGTSLSNPKVLLQWLMNRSGPLTSTGCDHGGFFKTKENLDDPDLQMRFLAAQALSADGMSTFTKFKNSAGHPDGFSFQSIACRAHSVGNVRLSSNDPHSKPIIEGCHLNDERDIVTLREGIKLSRKLSNSPALVPFKAEEIYPGKHIQSDEDIDNYIRNSVHTSNALVGTCRMGVLNDEHAVVDGQLRVKGVHGLRVVDASIMPKIPGGQTSAPTVMIAEKVADLLLSTV